ncbi:hypothetical protein [Nonomuraea sp. NPDC050310]|uniref:hypothetical protein n=1 Tax=unclassified Nonomuraea TaxID=2593643 RepID=UPI0033EBBD69
MSEQTRDRNSSGPLAPEQREQAREIVTRHLDARVRLAESVLAAAQQDLQARHTERQQWIGLQVLSAPIAREIEAAASDAYTGAALDVIHDNGGTSEAARRLREEHRLLQAYLHSEGLTAGRTPPG